MLLLARVNQKELLDKLDKYAHPCWTDMKNSLWQKQIIHDKKDNLSKWVKKKFRTVQFLWVYLLAVLFSNTYSWTLLSKVNIIIKNMTKQNHYPPYPQTAPLLVMGIRETRLSNYLFSLTLWLNEASFRFSQLWQNSSDDTVQQLWRQQVQQKHSFRAYTHLSCVFWETPQSDTTAESVRRWFIMKVLCNLF